MENVDNRIENLIKEGYLNKDDLYIINLMKLGKEITGEEIANNAINFHIDNIIKHKKINN